MTARTRGLALIVVIGILGILAVLAAAFVMMAQLERRASEQRVNAARAYLLARSGIEDALARLELGQDPRYGGEDWLLDGDQGADSFDHQQEVYRRGVLNVEDCPVRHALRPSFFVGEGFAPPRPALLDVEGRKRGTSGRLSGDYAAEGNTYALKVQSSNAGIFINGGALDDKDRDPDGPGATAAGFPLNPGAAAEVAPRKPNGVADYHDTSMEGPNGFLVRLLNNLDAVVTNGASAKLGEEIVGARPIGGYKSLDELKPILGPARFDQFKPYLTLHAWVDPKVVKPQPMDSRPQRWEDIDDAHRVGTEAKEISGVHEDPTPFTATVFGQNMGVTQTSDISADIGPRLTLNPGIRGNGKEALPVAAAVPWTPLDPTVQGALGNTDGPWTQTITATNQWEGLKTYPVRWERAFVYAWNQLRPAPVVLEPRSPVSLNAATEEVLASVFLGLKGTYLEVWEGSAGWDGGFGWYAGTFGYPYPSQATEETPWIRTRVDYGMTYGSSSRPWYGPADYDPHKPGPRDPSSQGIVGDMMDRGGVPVVQTAPLGRLKETSPVTQAQARAIAEHAQQVIAEIGPFRSWAQFIAFVSFLPRWEDVNEDSILDRVPYPVVGSGGTYVRRIYQREDANSDFIMQRETFSPSPGTSWGGSLPIAWVDPHLGKVALEASELMVPGLTFIQKDVVKAMANPNTDLNDFNPDANLWKEVDKTDLLDHTTELSLEGTPLIAGVLSLGRVVDKGGRLLALRQVGALVRLGDTYRDTTQEDFMRSYGGSVQPFPRAFILPLSGAPYPLAGGQPLVSYPEPQTLRGGTRPANASYDGQISLGFIGATSGLDETLRGDLFDTADAKASEDEAVPDLHGPFPNALLLPAGVDTGNVFPDGVYSEKDRSLKFRMRDTLNYMARPPGEVSNESDVFYIGCWAKVNWFPEASPRAHALLSMSSSKPYGWELIAFPVSDISSWPEALYFVPARNNFWQDQMGIYVHSASATQGLGWPCRALLWGTLHSFWGSDNLNRRGILELPSGTKPVGRLEAHRWVHLAMQGSRSGSYHTLLIVGCRGASQDGGWLNGNNWRWSMSPTHTDGTENHLRFGETASLHNMNYVADATFANVRAGRYVGDYIEAKYVHATAHTTAFTASSSPAVLGRYFKEPWATYMSPQLPGGICSSRITWTEIPCDLWYDENGDGWLGDPPTVAGMTATVDTGRLRSGHPGQTGASGIPSPSGFNLQSYAPRNDRFGSGGIPVPNGRRDVHIELEVWDDLSTDDKSDDVLLARFDDPAADNRIPQPRGRLTYKAVFVNEWDAATRANFPLDVTPFLDDVTLTYMEAGGPRVVAYAVDEM